MDVKYLLGLSVILQFTAAGLAVWLIRITRHRPAWLLIAAAVTLMGIRRSITLSRHISGDLDYPPDVSAELVALLISAVILSGIALLVPFLRSIRRSEEALRFTQFAVDHADEAVFWMNPEGRFVYVNEAAWTALGYTRQELLALSVPDIDPDIPVAVWPGTWRSVKERGSLTLQSHHRRKEGQVFPVEISANFHAYGGKEYICAYARDVTERERAVDELREAHDELERRVAERTADLRAANERLKNEVAERERAEADLRGSTADLARLAEEQFALLQHTRDFVYRHDRDGVFTYLSPAVEQVTGYSIDQWRKHYTAYMTDNPINDDVVARTEETLRTGQETPPYLVEIAHRSGHPVVLEVNERPYLEDGVVAGIIGVARDVTARITAERALRESEQRLQAILDNTTAVIYVKDLSGRHLLVNRSYAELFHLDLQAIVGATDHDIHPKEIADALRANDKKVIEARRPIEFEEVASPEGELRTYLSLKFPLFDEHHEPYAICGISTDISERKRVAEALKQAKDTAEAASRAKSVFLANISHEMRTPITAMLGAAELLVAPKIDRQESRERADMILRNGRHLLAMIEDLLDLSRAEAGKLEVRRVSCSLVDLVADVQALAQPLHHRPTVQFRIIYDTAIPRWVHTDPTRLKQAVSNLVNNALKFTASGHVVLRILVQRHEPDPRLAIVVEDTGPGIPPEHIERVFEAFTQIGPGASGVFGGVGLGLPLTRWIAEQLGGTLEVSSDLGRGSTFTLRVATGPLDRTDWVNPTETTLPAQPASAIDNSAAPGFRLHGSVLLAEDFPDTRVIIEHALTARGASVTTVTNGHEAIAAVTAGSFDLILLDIRMPGMDGLEAAIELRRRRCLAPIIALTASTSESDRRRVLEAGFDDLWTKPITLDALLLRTAAYLRTTVDDTPEIGGSTTAAPPDSLHDRSIAAAVDDFARSLGERIKVIRSSVETGELSVAREALHQLVGAAGIHGFMDISTEAARVLARIKDGRLARSPSELRELSSLITVAGGPSTGRRDAEGTHLGRDRGPPNAPPA